MTGTLKPIALLLGTAVLALVALPARAENAPRLAPTTFGQLVKPLPTPFDPKANAAKRLAIARAKAIRENKLLLLELGANWCQFCRSYAGTMALPPMQRFAKRHFVSVAVDVGRFDRNMAIVKHYELGELPGIPALLVIDPTDDRVLNEGEVSLFAHLPDRAGPQDIANWMARWAE